jgi:hypothetical protein
MNAHVISDNTLSFIKADKLLFLNTNVCLRLRGGEFHQHKNGYWLIGVDTPIGYCQIFRLLVNSSKTEIKRNTSLVSKALVNIFWKKKHAHMRLTV